MLCFQPRRRPNPLAEDVAAEDEAAGGGEPIALLAEDALGWVVVAVEPAAGLAPIALFAGEPIGLRSPSTSASAASSPFEQPFLLVVAVGRPE